VGCLLMEQVLFKSIDNERCQFVAVKVLPIQQLILPS
jgi:hypothetical protein